MTITINDRNIAYELERERDLGDVIRSIERLAGSNGSVIESITLDDKPVPLDEESPEFRALSSLGLDRIRELKVTTLPRAALAIRSVGTLGDHCAALLAACERFDRGSPDLPSLSDGFLEKAELLNEGIRATLGFLGIRARMVTAGDGNLADALGRLEAFISLYGRRYIDAAGSEMLKDVVTRLRGFLPKMLKWIIAKGRVAGELFAASLSEIFDDMRVQAERSLPLLEGIGRDLHRGEDRRALDTVFLLVELLDEIVRLLRTPGVCAREAAEFFDGIRLDLKELEEALGNGDMVTLADSIEYTMRPRFEMLVEILKKAHFSVDTKVAVG